ncbi:MAG: PEP-CTERM sorting domain-containing protein [Nitrosomonas sp.]|nr:PEP-CTERM sorting domain-containing protein [Nitrosomonas sp.]
MLHDTKMFLGGLLLLSVLAISTNAHAIFLIDDFTDSQTVSDSGTAPGTSSTPLALSATASSLTGIQRTLFSDATGGGFGNQTIQVGEPGGPGTGGLLAVSNNAFSAGTTTITWNGFTTSDFTAFSNAILLEVIAIDLNVNVEMIVNGDTAPSTSGLRAFSGPGNFFINFAGFGDPFAFQAVSQLQLKFTGPTAWDGQFRLLAADTNKVPEPAMLFLVGLGLLGLSAIRKH